MTSSGRNGNGKCWLSETFIQKDRIPGTAPTSSHLEYFKIFEESHMHGIHFNVQRTLEITYFFFPSVRQTVGRERCISQSHLKTLGGRSVFSHQQVLHVDPYCYFLQHFVHPKVMSHHVFSLESVCLHCHLCSIFEGTGEKKSLTLLQSVVFLER